MIGVRGKQCSGTSSSSSIPSFHSPVRPRRAEDNAAMAFAASRSGVIGGQCRVIINADSDSSMTLRQRLGEDKRRGQNPMFERYLAYERPAAAL